MLVSQKTGRAKLEDVTRILSDLKSDLDSPKLSSQQKQKLLEQLKIYGRVVDNSGPIYAQDGLRTLSRYAFEGDTTAVSQEALRCIANALLLVPEARQTLVDLGNGPHAAKKLESGSIDDEFLLSRILFLTTYNTTLDFAQLIQEHKLADNVNAAIARHADRYSEPRQASKEHTQPMELMALSETLKLIFNITHFHTALSPAFSSSIPHVFKILLRRSIPNPPLDAPFNNLINVLLNLDLDNNTPAVFPPSDPTINATHLTTLLDRSILAYPENELDTTVAPLLALLRRIYSFAPPAVQTALQSLLLPTPSERDKPLGKSNTLPARLLNLSTSAFTPTLRGSISAMFFELSDKDASTFVQNVGYGYASGFLMSNNIPMPEDAVRAHTASSSPSAASVPVNPITGQRLDMEEKVEETPMTQEEKEREAERLFVLFERLKATGVMNVQNPVEEAMRSGRIQELSDDED
ncbi:hypothetical protein ACN47E_000097 [Coniothyrium glycines]